MPTTSPRLRTALLALGLALAGCNDNDTPSSPLTVSPSLGLVRDADVSVLALDGRPLASGRMDQSGSLILRAAGLGGGFIVEVRGNDDATYFDEGVNAWRALPAGTVLHAVSADGRGEVAVTALTEIAYQRALQLAGGGPLGDAHIEQANAELAEWLARVPVSIAADGSRALPEATPDILAPALPVEGAVVLNSATEAGRYAILLASLAQQAFAGAAENADPCVVDAGCSPLLPVIALLATDFADGVLDNKNPHGGSRGLPFIDPDVNPVEVFPEAPPREDLTPQEEVGREFPGSYTLTCAGHSEPTTMVIEDNGAMTLSGPLGNYSLPFDDVTRKNPLVQHTYLITSTGKAFTARLSHLVFGDPHYDVVDDLEIHAHVNGSVQLVKDGVTVDCSTSFTHGTLQPAIPYFTDFLVGNHFFCLANSPDGPVEVTVDIAPTTWSINGVVQPQQHGAITVYKHIMFKQAYPADTLHTYEQYHWGEEQTPEFFSLSRAMLRYQEGPLFNVFDMGVGEYIQGPTGCYPERPDWFDYAIGEGNILADFGETELTL